MSTQESQSTVRWHSVTIRATVGLLVAFLLSLSGVPGVNAPATASSSLHRIVFPVAQQDLDGLRWTDTWGAGRSSGRSHIGVDMLGDRMMELLAVADSTVVWGRFDNRRGTIIRLRDYQGWEYQYIHLNNDTPGTDNGKASCDQVLSAKLCAARDGSDLTKGTKLSAGEFIGYMGDSGNAEWTAPHLHFEIYQPNGQAVNPTPFVDAALEGSVSTSTESHKEEAPEASEASSAERELARSELAADVSDAATKLSIRLNGVPASEQQRQAIAEAIETSGVEQAIANLAKTNPAAAKIDRLYLAFFQRLPDAEGMDYWLDAVGDGADMEEIAEWFAMSGEFHRRHSGRDFGQFLNQLYLEVLNRQPDETGKVYWLDQLKGGTVTRGTIVVYFTEGDELVRAHQRRTELSVAYRALDLGRPTVGEVAEWRSMRENKNLVDALEDWLAG